MPSRRAFLTGLSGVTLGAATAGCISDLTDSASTGESLGLTDDRLAFRDGFENQRLDYREKYGDHGVWGLDGPRRPALGRGVVYEGAWTTRFDLPERNGGRPFATGHAAALVFSLDERRRVWFWLGARARQPDDRLGRTNLTRLSVSTQPGTGWELTGAAPRAPTRDGPVSVALDDRGPRASVPLETGGLAADTFELGPEGTVEVAWQGGAGGTRAVHAVVEYAPLGDGEAEAFGPPVSVRATATRGAF